MTQPELQLPLPGPRKMYCEGNGATCSGDVCPLFGTPMVRQFRDGKQRVRGCDDAQARGRRSKKKGADKQTKAVTALGIVRTSGHEEFLGGTVRVEVKAGAQVGPIDTRFRKAKAQSDAERAFGDNRPFAMVAMPDGSSDGYVLVRLSDVYDFVDAIVEQRAIS